jgi:inorganic pyrophosphatase/manganese-dependent inorganic pyrophosphatase
MAENYIVTSGEKFTDIDAYACAIAYAELLRLEGKNAEVVLPGTLNNSITPIIRSWNLPYATKPSVRNYKAIVVDVSEPSHIASCAPFDLVTEIYDHRYGFQDVWEEKLGKNAHIEAVGACTTLIWEQFKDRGFADKISKESANLLLIGTVSNTLDFGAQVTNQRDVAAFNELTKHIDLPPNWKEVYFNEQETTVFKNPIKAIMNDTKVLDVPGAGFPIVMGQMELWDSRAFITSHIESIEKALTSFGVENWFMSSPCIKEKRNYIYTKSSRVKRLLGDIIAARFTGDIGITDGLWLRKEVRKKLFELANR